jgi:hypothetical protein
MNWIDPAQEWRVTIVDLVEAFLTLSKVTCLSKKRSRTELDFSRTLCNKNDCRALIDNLRYSHCWKGTVLRRAESVQNSNYVHKILYIVE